MSPRVDSQRVWNDVFHAVAVLSSHSTLQHRHPLAVIIIVDCGVSSLLILSAETRRNTTRLRSDGGVLWRVGCVIPLMPAI